MFSNLTSAVNGVIRVKFYKKDQLADTISCVLAVSSKVQYVGLAVCKPFIDHADIFV